MSPRPMTMLLPLLAMLTAASGCGATRGVERIGVVREWLGREAEDTRAVYVASDGSIAFEVIGRLANDERDRRRGPRVRYVIVDAATVERAIAEAERRPAATEPATQPTTRPVVWIGATPGPPARVVPPSVDAPSATPADLPPAFRASRCIEWNGQPVPRVHQITAVTAQPVELNGRTYLLIAGPYPWRDARTLGGSIAYATLIVPALAIDAVGGAVTMVTLALTGL